MHKVIENKDFFPLTNLQKAYFVGRDKGFEAGGIPTYIYHEFENDFEHDRFEKVLNKTIENQPMLRAEYNDISGQKIIPAEKFGYYHVEHYDFSALSDEEQEKRISEIREEITASLKNSEKMFVFRTASLNNGKTCIFSGCNLLVADAFSLVFILMRELKSGYENDTEDEISPLSFSDYVSMKEAEKNTEAYEADRNFWREKLSEISPAPDIPIKKEGLSEIPEGKRLKTYIEKEKWQSIRKISSKKRLTPTVTVMTAYSMTLGLWSNQESFCINMPVMDRPHNSRQNIDFSNVIGDFTSVRLIDIKNELKPELNFWEYAENVKSALKASSKHKLYDGTEIMKDIVRTQNMPEKALMPYVFTSMILGNSAYDAVGQFGKIRYSISQTPQVFIDCQVMEENDRLMIVWDYDRKLFDEDTIKFMFGKFTELLNSVDDCGTVSENFFELSERDRNILDDYNATEQEIPCVTAVEMIKENFEKYSNKIAVKDDSDSLTYGELDRLSDEAANILRENGVNDGDVVAVSSARNVWTIVNILAVLKCNCAFVNINEDYPENRKNYILEKSCAKIMIDGNKISRISPENCRKFEYSKNVDGDSLAYAIFTSGSTGTPKGVAVTHKGLCNTVLDINRRFEITEKDRILCVTSFCFDLSVYDIFGAFASGAEFYIARDSRDVDDLINIIDREKITFLNCVPAITNLIVSRCGIRENYQNFSMRLFMMSGDWIPVSLPNEIKKYFPESISVSLGGATEGSIWSIFHVIQESDSMLSSIPYGRPLSNQKMYILNEALHECPVNTTGEIYIGGESVAVGYLNDGEKTALAFINTEKFGKIYKTGDFGRISEKGIMEFLGRRDSQVKIHGHRIELSEIENVLIKYKDIKNAVADIKKSETGSVHLCVYYVSPENYSKEELSEYLGTFLTRYMIPEYYINIESIPLTSNGKVNRKALPSPDFKVSSAKISENGNYSDTENKLVDIWCSILGTDKDSVNINTGFFNLGGDSVNMIQTAGEIEKVFGVNIPFQKFLQHSTIKEIAALIDSEKSDSDSTEEESFSISPESKYEPFSLSELQESYFIGRSADGYKGLVTNGYVELECSYYDDEKFRRVLKKLIERHDMLRTVFHADSTQQILETAELPEITLADKTGLTDEELENYCIEVRKEMTLVRLDLEKAPLIKILVSLLENHRAIVHIYVDGLIIDGWSYQIFHLELEKLYSDENAELKPLKASYRDYVKYKEYQKTTKKYQKAKEYWLSRIPELPEAGTLPLLSDFKSLTSIEGGQIECGLDINDWHRLEEKSKIYGISPFTVIFTSFALTIARWNKNQKFMLNIPEFDRPQFHEDVNKIIGICSSFLLFTAENNPDATFFETVRKNHEQLWTLKENNSFSGMEVLREIYKGMRNYETALVPIVFGMMANVEIPENRVMTVKYQENHTTQIWIDINTILYNDRIEFNWNYIKGLMDGDMLRRMVEVQKEILHRAIYEKDFWEKPCKVSLPEYDRQITESINNTDKPFEYRPFSELIAESFEKYSDKIFISDENQSLTYGEFKKYVMGMAERLIDSGCKQGDYISVHTRKSIEQIIAVVAVEYIGAVYVPIEYNYTHQLTLNCMKNINSVYLITDSDINSPDIKVISAEAVKSEKYIPPVHTDENSLAAAINTSGSTGLPKTVKVTQKGLLNGIVFTNRELGINSSDTFIALENYAHDMSMYDIFGSMFAGAGIAVPVEEKAKDPEQWILLMEKYHVTLWNSVPAFIQMIIEHSQGNIPDCMKNLKYILSGGDYLNIKTAGILKKNIPNLRLINVGGPTETTIWNIGHEVTDKDIENELIPYGRPIDNTKYYILNDNMEICPVNVVGMMYCAGIGVSQGYINNPAENFRNFMVFPQTGELVYRTGDLGKYDENGNIIFMGRNDLQVEINGKRIELNGISKSIISHKDVQNCVSALTDDGNNIISYYIADRDISAEEFKNFLSDRLPYFAIPKFYVRIDEVPLTNNGKTDYKKLAEINICTDEEPKPDNVPRDETEKKLLDTYSEMLGIQADLHTDFFEMGGNSLMAVKMVSRIRSEFDIPISLTEMFSVLTISELYDLILKKLNEKENSPNEN